MRFEFNRKSTKIFLKVKVTPFILLPGFGWGHIVLAVRYTTLHLDRLQLAQARVPLGLGGPNPAGLHENDSPWEGFEPTWPGLGSEFSNHYATRIRKSFLLVLTPRYFLRCDGGVRLKLLHVYCYLVSLSLFQKRWKLTARCKTCHIDVDVYVCKRAIIYKFNRKNLKVNVSHWMLGI